MRNLYLSLRLQAAGSRRTLKTRLLKEKAGREQEVTVEEPYTTGTSSVAIELSSACRVATAFNEEQLAQISEIVSSFEIQVLWTELF